MIDETCIRACGLKTQIEIMERAAARLGHEDRREFLEENGYQEKKEEYARLLADLG